jgi:hypothetical protein
MEYTMSKEHLEKQAGRADNLADQTVDDEVRQNLRDAAKEYRQTVNRRSSSERGVGKGRPQ